MSAATPHVLAVDLGTSGPKVGLVSERCEITASAFVPVAMRLVEGGGAEQDAEEWWRAVISATREVLELSGVDRGAVLGIACTGQWSGTVAVDERGTPLARAITWMDSRGSALVAERVRGRGMTILGYGPRKLLRWVRLTGGAPGLSGKDPLAHILFMREAMPGVYASAYKFLEPVDYLNMRLTGKAVSSYDSIALHWVTDNRKLGSVRYDAKLLEMAGLERSKLPDLVAPCTVIGRLMAARAAEMGLRSGIPVVTASGDLHSAIMGAGRPGYFEPHLYIGTSSWITCHVPFKKTDAAHNLGSLPAALPGRYLVADEQETAGACLTFLADRLLFASDGAADGGGELGRPENGPGRPENVYRALDDLAARAPVGSGKVMFTPWLNGERSPVDDRTMRAGLHNVSLSTTRADVVRAVFEGVALNSRWLLEAVERFCGRRFADISFIGGGALSDIWSRIHADVMGKRVCQLAQPDLANLRGAGVLALITLGRARLEDVPAMVQQKAVYEPDPEAGRIYDERFGELINLYRRTKRLHQRLNRDAGQPRHKGQSRHKGQPVGS